MEFKPLSYFALTPREDPITSELTLADNPLGLDLERKALAGEPLLTAEARKVEVTGPAVALRDQAKRAVNEWLSGQEPSIRTGVQENVAHLSLLAGRQRHLNRVIRTRETEALAGLRRAYAKGNLSPENIRLQRLFMLADIRTYTSQTRERLELVRQRMAEVMAELRSQFSSGPWDVVQEYFDAVSR
jgi:hypothetical protein